MIHFTPQVSRFNKIKQKGGKNGAKVVLCLFSIKKIGSFGAKRMRWHAISEIVPVAPRFQID